MRSQGQALFLSRGDLEGQSVPKKLRRPLGREKITELESAFEAEYLFSVIFKITEHFTLPTLGFFRFSSAKRACYPCGCAYKTTFYPSMLLGYSGGPGSPSVVFKYGTCLLHKSQKFQTSTKHQKSKALQVLTPGGDPY